MSATARVPPALAGALIPAIVTCAFAACGSDRQADSARPKQSAESNGDQVAPSDPGPSQPPAPAAPPTPLLATAAAMLDPPSESGSMAPQLVALEDGVGLSWLEPSRTQEGGRRPGMRLRFSRRVGADGRWTDPVTIAEGPEVFANWADTPSVVDAGGRSLVAHWARLSSERGYAYDVMLSRSDDRGTTWRELGAAHDDGTHTEHGFVSLLAEGGGAVRAFWLDGRELEGANHDESGGAGHDTPSGAGPARAMTLRTAVVTDSVSGGERLDAQVCDCCGTAAAMTAAGPVVVYRDRTDDQIRDMSIIRRNKRKWTKPQPVYVDGWKIPGCPVNGPSVAAAGRRLAAAWFTYASDRPAVKLALSADAGASFAVPVEVAGPGEHTPMGRVAVVFDAAGEALVSWMASQGEEATIFVRRLNASGELGAPLPLIATRAERKSGFPRMVRIGDELLVAWTQLIGEESRVRVARLPSAAVPRDAAAIEPNGLAGAEGAGRLPALGVKLPDYAAETMDGGEVSLAALRGSVVLVNFWATWCEPCRAEMPELQRLQETFGARGLKVIGVSVDSEQNNAQVREFVEQGGIRYPVWRDPSYRAARVLGVDMLPTSFLIDAEGSVIWRGQGALRADDPQLTESLEAHLAGR